MARPAILSFGKGVKRQVLLCVLCGLVAALISFWANLPMTPLADRLVQAAAKQGLGLTINQPGLALPLGLSAARIEVKIPDLPRPPIALQNVNLSPVWSSLFGKNPGLDLEAGLMSGKLEAELTRQGDLHLQLHKLQVSEALGPQLPLQVVAVVEAGSFTGRLPLVGRNRSQIELTLDNAALVGLKQYGSNQDRLTLGRIKLQGSGRGSTLKIGSIQSKGGDIEVQANGSLMLGRTPATSRLALSVQLKPTASLDPGLRSLLPLLGKAGHDGNYRLRLSGPLTAVQVR